MASRLREGWRSASIKRAIWPSLFPFFLRTSTVRMEIDFEVLKKKLTEKLKALLQQETVFDEIANDTPVAQVHGLSQPEILVIAVIAGEAFMPNSSATASSVRRSAERTGITSMGFNVAVRRLLQKQLIVEEELWDERTGESYSGMKITESGWAWIDQNENQFVL